MMKDDEHNTRRYAPVWIAMGVVAFVALTFVALTHVRSESRRNEDPQQEQSSGPALVSLFDIDTLQESDAVKKFVKTTWPSVLRTCPGVTDYAEDLSFVRIDAASGDNVSDVGVYLHVSDSPTKVPREFMANGHTCEFRISSDGTLTFQKAVCAEVCFEQKFESDGSDMVFQLSGYHKDSSARPPKSDYVENDIKYPTNGDFEKYTSMLPAGFQAGLEYPYGELSDAIHERVAKDPYSEYWLKCTLGERNDPKPEVMGCSESQDPKVRPQGYWRVVYYSEIKQTWLEEVKRNSGHTTITILKVAKGRRPDLNLE